MKKGLAFAVVTAFALGGALGAFAFLPRSTGGTALSVAGPVWSEVQWPFPMDQWGRGRAFHCKPGDCGSEVNVYLRAKLGACNCATGVSDDAELDRMSDFDLVGGEVLPLGDGRAIKVASMNGRSRAYAITGRQRPGKSVLSVAFNERCDMVVATAVLPHDRPATIEPGVIEFLNSRPVMQWVEVALGL
jgi:hypothetical protein